MAESKISKEEEEALKAGELLASLRDSEGYKLVLLPFLQSKVQNSWLDPRKSKSKEEFDYQYMVAWGFAQAASEIIGFIDASQKQTEKLRLKKTGDLIEPDFKIGR